MNSSSSTSTLSDPLCKTTSTSRPALGLVIAAFAAVYIVWGSTYLGMRVAIDSIPPLIMAGCRFMLAGTILYTIMRLRGAPRPQLIHWRSSTISGGLLLMLGNGGICWAQQTVPTGIAALVVASVPLWTILIDWLRPRGIRPTGLIIAGLLIGMVGVTVIILGKGPLGQRMVDPFAAVVLLTANVCWASGSIYARHSARTESPLLGAGMQMICGGALQFLLGVCLGELSGFDPFKITASSAWAFAYLTFIGSLVGYTAFFWLLQVSTPARVSTHAYVNPFVAVLLGWWFLHEPIPQSLIIAGLLILSSVVLITRSSPK